jgi:hypothetical protein
MKISAKQLAPGLVYRRDKLAGSINNRVYVRKPQVVLQALEDWYSQRRQSACR